MAENEFQLLVRQGNQGDRVYLWGSDIQVTPLSPNCLDSDFRGIELLKLLDATNNGFQVEAEGTHLITESITGLKPTDMPPLVVLENPELFCISSVPDNDGKIEANVRGASDIDTLDGDRISFSPLPTQFSLTPRQLQVLELVAQDLNYAQIALELDISHSTVAKHASAAIQKCGAQSITGAVAKAIREGLI